MTERRCDFNIFYLSRDPIRTYREFYINDKVRFARWAHTPPPSWWPNEAL